MAGVTKAESAAAKPKLIKAIPFSGGTTIIVRPEDFKRSGVDHPQVQWDYRINDFSVVVGEDITEEAANVLVKNFPDSFTFV